MKNEVGSQISEDKKPKYIKINKTYLINVLVFTAGMLITTSFHHIFKEEQPWNEEKRLPEQYKFINPLLECNSNLGSTLNSKKAKEEIQQYINDKIADKSLNSIGIYYRDLNNGPWFGINQDAMFSPASLVKVPMMMAYFKLAEKDPKILEIIIKSPKSSEINYADVNIVPRQKLEPETNYSVDQLIERMIKYSDNEAYKLLRRNLPDQIYYETYTNMGVDLSILNTETNGNVLSIRDYSAFFRILYNSSYLTRYYSEKALTLLSQIDFKDGMAQGLPEGTQIAHKFGERSYDNSIEKQFHECGIVYKPNRPFLLCVMTRGSDETTLFSVIKDITNITYKMAK